MTPFRPMLGVAIKSPSALRYPLWASPKIDGIRALVRDGVVYSRSMKPIPNSWVQEAFGLRQFEGFDGELILNNSFNETTSVVMSHDKPITGLQYKVFDLAGRHQKEPFYKRQEILNECFDLFKYRDDVELLPQGCIYNEKDLQLYEEIVLGMGYEGVMLRNPNAPYKQGRSTLREQGMLKVKRFEDMEAVVTGFEPLYTNENTAHADERGFTKRSTRQEGKVQMDMLGTLHVKGVAVPWQGKEFCVGGGFTAQQRIDLWQASQQLLGKVIRVRYFPYGSVDAPRFPVFAGFRDPLDMGEPA